LHYVYTFIIQNVSFSCWKNFRRHIIINVVGVYFVIVKKCRYKRRGTWIRHEKQYDLNHAILSLQSQAQWGEIYAANYTFYDNFLKWARTWSKNLPHVNKSASQNLARFFKLKFNLNQSDTTSRTCTVDASHKLFPRKTRILIIKFST
jgi:hypothetical protein